MMSGTHPQTQVVIDKEESRQFQFSCLGTGASHQIYLYFEEDPREQPIRAEPLSDDMDYHETSPEAVPRLRPWR